MPPVPLLPFVEKVVDDVPVCDDDGVPGEDFELISMLVSSPLPPPLTAELPLVEYVVEDIANDKDIVSSDDVKLKLIFDDIPIQPFDSVIPQCSLLDLGNLPPFLTFVYNFPNPTDVILTPSGLLLDAEDGKDDVLCIEDLEMSSFVHVTATAMIEGKHPVVFRTSALGSLYDTGANVTITKHMDEVVEVEPIIPFSVFLATTVKGVPKPSRCIHRGFLSIPMVDGDIHYQRAYYNADTSDTIISPQAICDHSGGIFTKWTQMGTTHFAGDIL